MSNPREGVEGRRAGMTALGRGGAWRPSRARVPRRPGQCPEVEGEEAQRGPREPPSGREEPPERGAHRIGFKKGDGRRPCAAERARPGGGRRVQVLGVQGGRQAEHRRCNPHRDDDMDERPQARGGDAAEHEGGRYDQQALQKVDHPVDGRNPDGGLDPAGSTRGRRRTRRRGEEPGRSRRSPRRRRASAAGASSGRWLIARTPTPYAAASCGSRCKTCAACSPFPERPSLGRYATEFPTAFAISRPTTPAPIMPRAKDFIAMSRAVIRGFSNASPHSGHVPTFAWTALRS